MVTCIERDTLELAWGGGGGVVLAWRVPVSTCSFVGEGRGECMEGAEIPEGEPSYAVITLPLRVPRDSHSRNLILASVSTHPPLPLYPPPSPIIPRTPSAAQASCNQSKYQARHAACGSIIRDISVLHSPRLCIHSRHWPCVSCLCAPVKVNG